MDPGARPVLYRLDASIRVDGSHSRSIADIVEQEWRDAYPEVPIVHRHLGGGPIPASLWASAVFGGRTPEDARSAEQNAAIAFAATLTDELAGADVLLFAVPLYNFGVSQHFKACVDTVITDPRMGAGAEPILGDKPAVLVTFAAGTTSLVLHARAGITRPVGCGASSLTSGVST
jgi:FMN-dependent NADH-azoreductase